MNYSRLTNLEEDSIKIELYQRFQERNRDLWKFHRARYFPEQRAYVEKELEVIKLKIRQPPVLNPYQIARQAKLKQEKRYTDRRASLDDLRRIAQQRRNEWKSI